MRVFNDAQKMLKKAVETKSLRVSGTLAFFPANSVGDDVHVFDSDDERKGDPKAVFYGLRQQVRGSIFQLFCNSVLIHTGPLALWCYSGLRDIALELSGFLPSKESGLSIRIVRVLKLVRVFSRASFLYPKFEDAFLTLQDIICKVWCSVVLAFCCVLVSCYRVDVAIKHHRLTPIRIQTFSGSIEETIDMWIPGHGAKLHAKLKVVHLWDFCAQYCTQCCRVGPSSTPSKSQTIALNIAFNITFS